MIIVLITLVAPLCRLTFRQPGPSTASEHKMASNLYKEDGQPTSSNVVFVNGVTEFAMMMLATLADEILT